MSGFANYTGSLTIATTDDAQSAAPNSSLSFGTNGNNTPISTRISYVLGTDVIGGVNEVADGVLTIAESGSATIDLQSLTDMLGVTDIALDSLKKYVFRLLSPNDDSLAGTDCSSVTIGNAGSDPHPLNMGGTDPTLTLTGNPDGNGDAMAYGSDTAAGLTVSDTVCNVLFTNNDSSHAAAVYYNLGGYVSA